MFSKSKVCYKPRNSQPLFCPVYELAHPLAAYQPFDKWKEKITPGIHLGMSPIHSRKAALVLSLLTGRVSPQFYTAFYPSIITINGCDGNIAPLSYWKAMCGFVKGKKLVFVQYDQNYPSTTLVSPSDQG